MIYKILLGIVMSFSACLFSTQHIASAIQNKDTVSVHCHKVMANTFSEMILSENPALDIEAQQKVERLTNFIFEKLVPEKLDKIEFSQDDPSRFTLYFTHAHMGKILKVEKGAEAGFKGINFTIKNELSGFFSPEDAAIYIENNAYSGKHSFFKTQYSLKKVKFHINGNQSEDIKIETDLGSATKEWQENEMIATFKHMIWKKG